MFVVFVVTVVSNYKYKELHSEMLYPSAGTKNTFVFLIIPNLHERPRPRGRAGRSRGRRGGRSQAVVAGTGADEP